ncbi:MAG TPA: AgmX/PglI C-terminal domain-containing protein [Polyangia bacterium]|nr:AgmX/PglI C-terminal domain-containing protein [Polyangia bacterium]
MSAILSVALLAAAATATPVVKSIDAQCKAAARLDEAHQERYRAFADVSQAILPAANEARGSWREFQTRGELRTFAQTGAAPNTQASIWAASDGTRVAQMYFQSDAGDWSQDVEYCFRADGSLARLVGALSNYAADVEGERTIHFDAHGVVLSTAGTARSLETRKPLPTLDGLDTPPVYPTFASLPFLAAGRGAQARAAAKPPMVNDGPVTRDPHAPPEPPPPRDEQRIVSDEIRSRLGHVKACYERELAKTPGLAGRVVMRWTIGGAGATRDIAVVNDDLHAPAVTACIEALIARWLFDVQPKGPTIVEFPFVFQSRR